jgi:hypothetical protein
MFGSMKTVFLAVLAALALVTTGYSGGWHGGGGEGSTGAGITDTDSTAPDIIDSTGVGVGLPVDTIRGGCFRCRCPTRITDITVPVMDTDTGMEMGTNLATGTGTDSRSLKRSIITWNVTVAYIRAIT